MTIFAKYARWISTASMGAFLAATLTACGGGGGAAGTPTVGGGGSTPTTPTAVAKLVVELDKKTVTNTGATTVDVKVTSTDANGATVGSVPVAFAVDSNAIITPGGTQTDTTGVLHATVGLGSDHTNRTITVTVAATDGKSTITQKASFDVVDSVTGGKVADLSMTANRSSLPNDGSATATITITSLDANRSAVGGSPVTLAIADPAGTAFVSPGGSTDATSGQLNATVSIGGNNTNRTLTVTATSGTVTRSITLNVITPTSATPLANDMTLVLDKLSIGNTGGDKVTATVTAVDAQRNVITGIPVSFSVNNSATVAVLNGTTNASGQSIATVTSGADKSNRLITVTATSGTLTRTATFQVLGAKLTGTAVPQQPTAGSAGNRIDYRLTDVNQNPMTFVPISVTASGLTPASGQTDANGAFSYTYTAPATAGPIDITATAGGVSAVTTVTVPSSTSTVPTATPAVVSASVQATPSVVSVNTGSTNNQVVVRAMFLATGNAPVQNVRVRFDLNGDANSIGGTLSAGTQIVYADTAGIASTTYTPANRASPTSGVTIRACWDYNDFAAGACPNSVLTTLTVVSDPVSVTIGTNELIDTTTNLLTYRKQFVVLVVDAAGQPKADVQITPVIDLPGYYKGYYNFVSPNWIQFYDRDTAGNTQGIASEPVCYAEDINRNGLIDGSEDQNGNGQLDPRKSDASITMTGSTRTDANGQAIITLEYPRSVASWVAFTISATAGGVVSPPATISGVLPVPAAAITATGAPAFSVSPYGRRRVIADGNFCKNAD